MIRNVTRLRPVIIAPTRRAPADVMQHAYAAMLRRHRLADFLGVECKRIAGMPGDPRESA